MMTWVHHINAHKEFCFFPNTYRPGPAASYIFLHIRSKWVVRGNAFALSHRERQGERERKKDNRTVQNTSKRCAEVQQSFFCEMQLSQNENPGVTVNNWSQETNVNTRWTWKNALSNTIAWQMASDIAREFCCLKLFDTINVVQFIWRHWLQTSS